MPNWHKCLKMSTKLLAQNKLKQYGGLEKCKAGLVLGVLLLLSERVSYRQVERVMVISVSGV